MIVAAGLLPGRAAGMKDSITLFRRNARKLQFLECRCWYRGNLGPVLHDSRCKAPRFADFSISGVVLELECEKLERKRVKFQFRVGSARGTDRTPQRGVPTVNGFAQARGKAGKFVVHAVFGYGWFSATAEAQGSKEPDYGN